MAARLSADDRDQAAEFVAQFVALIHAWQSHAFEKAAAARAELKRLGITVQIGRRSRALATSRAPHDGGHVA